MVFEAGQHLLFAEVLDRISPSVMAELNTQFAVCDQARDSRVKSEGILRRHNQAASFLRGVATHNQRDLRARIGSRYDRTSAGKHAGKARWHHQVGRAGALREQMNVGCIEQVVQAVQRLQRKQRNVCPSSYEDFKLGTERPVTTEDEVHSRIFKAATRRKCSRKWRKQFQALFRAHVS